jgi:putative membrane protein
MSTLTTNILAAVIFAVLGIVTFIVAFVAIDRLTPFNLWKEIIEEQNSALAILIGLIALGISVIIAAAIH